jgi:hypothetical protein
MTQLQELPALSFVQHLRTQRQPLRVRRADTAPRWADVDAHRAAYEQDLELYALSAVAEKVQPAQQARTLYQLLAASRSTLAPEARRNLERVSSCLLVSLPADQVLGVFLALRRARANHKHTRRAILRYVLNHPALEELARRRRPALRDVLEHALGRNVARGCANRLAGNGPVHAYVRSHLFRFADDRRRALEVFRFLYHQAPCPAPQEGTALLLAGRVEAAKPERPRTVTLTNRGDVAATLVHLYRGGDNAELRQWLSLYVEAAAAELPRFDGTVALVLDASASTCGYGEREFACVSQSQAFRLVLERCGASVRVFRVGGDGDPPAPEGPTDLASALLDALEADADVIAVVSDGYENTLAGDLARVVATLPALGLDTPVVFCHSKFTEKDDLALRRPAPALPEVAFWHQDDFADVFWSLFARARAGKGDAFLRGHLHRRLDALEKGVTP